MHKITIDAKLPQFCVAKIVKGQISEIESSDSENYTRLNSEHERISRPMAAIPCASSSQCTHM